MKWLMLGMMVSSLSQATVTSDYSQCEDEFTARVKEIIEPVGAIGGLSKEKVLFDNDRSLDVLMNGPFQVEQGKEYRVHLRNGYLCWIEAV